MSAFNGSGTFVISGTGLPFVTGTTISSTVANQLNTDLATGLSTCLTKDGQSTPTANIPLGGYKATGLGVATATGDALSYGNTATLAATTFTDTILPSTDGTLEIGGTSNNWANIYTKSVSYGADKMLDASGTTLRHGSGGNWAVQEFLIGGLEAGRFANDLSFVVGTTTSGGWNSSGLICAQSSSKYTFSGYASAFGSGCFLYRVDNTGVAFGYFNYNGSTVGSITTNGTATTYGTSSDARLKENITDAGDAGAIIDALRVRQWDWKSNGTHEAFGFVAQEEYAVYVPGVVPGDDGEKIERQWSRDDSKLVPLLVKEIQSLRVRISALETQ